MNTTTTNINIALTETTLTSTTVFYAVEEELGGHLLRIDAEGETYDIWDFCGVLARRNLQLILVDEDEAWIVETCDGVCDPMTALRGLPLERTFFATFETERRRSDAPGEEEYTATDKVAVYRVRRKNSPLAATCFLAAADSVSDETAAKAIEKYPRDGVILLPMEALEDAARCEKLREMDDDLR